MEVMETSETLLAGERTVLADEMKANKSENIQIVSDSDLGSDSILDSNSAPDSDFSALFVSHLVLSNFRNYTHRKFSFDPRPIVITGKNGAGKTNILEAISLLAPGRGLRQAKLELLDRIDDGQRYPWGVTAEISLGDIESYTINTGKDTSTFKAKRITKVDGDIIKNQTELARIGSVMWLTPQMDGLFIGAASDRRKFLDRLVYNFDPEHASRVYSYEYSMRERAKLLQMRGDSTWITTLEKKMAERAVAIVIARMEAVEMLRGAIEQAPGVFPKAEIGVEGDVETLVQGHSALEAEEKLLAGFYRNRASDASSGRTQMGAHRSDFVVFHTEKSMPAASCSTGEQKALLLSIILAEARAKATWKRSVPILLLDEVVAHLDEARRNALFEEIISLKAQAWMTGTDKTLFAGMLGESQTLSL
jgi:DNA replication and repair protein RecF